VLNTVPPEFQVPFAQLEFGEISVSELLLEAETTYGELMPGFNDAPFPDPTVHVDPVIET
jgi:hypothetical protein